MRKVLLVLFAACMVGSVGAQERESFSHLSIGLKGGMNVMRDYGISVPVKERVNFVAGGSFEYTFNPLWGLGLDYTYLPYDQDYASAKVNVENAKVTAAANEITLYASVNLANLLAQYRSRAWQPFNAYATVGGGLSFYDYDNTASSKKGNDNTIVVPVGLNLEYNFSKVFAMSLGTEYRWHQANDMKMDLKSSTGGNSYVLGTLGFRFKFGSSERHVRNLSYAQFQRARSFDMEAGMFELVELKKETFALKAQLAEQAAEKDALQNYVREMGDAVKELDRRLNRFMGNASSATERTADDIAAIKRAQETAAKDAFNTLEFETGSAVIKAGSYKGLDKLAESLRSNPGWNVKLSGYTDSSGSLAKNVQLSKERAEAVKLYLERKGIAGNRIVAEGYGPENPIASNATAAGRAKNRRVEILID